MVEKTEWEVVDDPGSSARNTGRAPEYEQNETRHAPRSAQAASAMLGPWWKWKLAGVAALALVAFAFFATVIGVAALSLVALALVGAGVRKVRHWLRGERSTSIMRP